MSRASPCPACTLLATVWLAASVHGADPPSNQHDAAQRLAELQREIQQLQQQLAESRSAHQASQQALRELDLTMQENTRTLRQLDIRRGEHERRLEALEREQILERQRMQQSERGLARQLVETYRLARQSRIKLVLNQDDPLLLARLLAYHDYINRAQAGRIEALREALARLTNLHRQIEVTLARIDTLRKQELDALETLQAQRQERARMVRKLAQQIGSEASRLAELERDRADLEQLIERLSDALADIPADLGRQLGLRAGKGHLPMPVKAPVRQAFGQPRAAGLRWQGWLMGAPAGAEVRNIAHGRVAFSDWFRGYGLMMIIDHGQGFMSLYGYNESLLWDVGDWVGPGTVIATVGISPGGEQGLYFELRHEGRALDPAAWLNR